MISESELQDKINNLLEDNPEIISGTLCIKTKHKYGFNSRNIPIRLFKPFKQKYPNFKVASKIEGDDEYIIIKPSKIENGKLPFGENKGYKIGKVNDIVSIRLAMQHYFGLYFKKYKGSVKNNIVTKSQIHEKERIVSIDPKGCVDIDDALSLNKNILRIYLADITSLNSELFQFASNKMTTIYSDDVLHMYPDKFMSYCSLLKEQNRIANICEIELNDNFEIIKIKFYQKEIIVTENLSYDEVDNTSDTYLLNIMDVIEKIKFDYNSQNNSRSHKIIEKVMVLSNHLVVNEFKKKNKNFIVRNHKSSTSNTSSIPDEVKDFYKIYLSNSAEYITYNGESKHSGLGITEYTHFTSPLRRFIDTLNHLILFTNREFSKEELDSYCLKANDINKRIKKFEIECRKLELLNDEREYFYGYIIDFIEVDVNYFKIKFYIPDLNMVLSHPIYNKKLLSLYNVSLNENKLKITGEENKEYYQFQVIDIKVHKRINATHFKHKLIYEILN